MMLFVKSIEPFLKINQSLNFLFKLQDLQMKLATVEERIEELEAVKRMYLPSQSAIEYITQDPCYDLFPLQKAIPAMAVALVELYFGVDVLGESSLTGKLGAKLDYRIFSRIEEDVRKKFGTRLSSQQFTDAFKVCIRSMSIRCKTLRQSAKNKRIDEIL